MPGIQGYRRCYLKEWKRSGSYQGITGKVVYPLVLIPYDNVVALSEETEQYILRKNLQGLSYVAVLIALAILGIIFMSLRSAKKFTRPIHELATAGKKIRRRRF